MKLRRVVALGVAVTALIIAPSMIDMPLALASSPSAVVIVDGRRIAAVPGAVLKQGRIDRERKVCEDVNHSIEIFAPKAIGYASVGVGVDEQCRLVVQEVVFEVEHRLPDGRLLRPAADARATLRERFLPSSIASADSQHEIYGRHLMHEQFHVRTTLAHMGFTYWESPTSVYSPSTTAAYCWRAGTGWTILNCYGWVELNGPSQVQQFTGGDFENQGGSLRHHLGAHPNAWIGGNGVFCDAVGSSMPFGWHDHCEYGRLW